MGRNFQQAREEYRRQNADALWPIRFDFLRGPDGQPLQPPQPVILEFRRGRQSTELTWNQPHGRPYYAPRGFLFSSRLDQTRVEEIWGRHLRMDSASRITFSDVVRAYMNDEPDQYNVSVKIEEIEVYSGGGGRVRLTNVVEIAEGTFVTFPRLNGRTAWWGYSAFASDFSIHRRASGMMSLLPWLRYAARLGAMAAGNVGGEIGEEVGGWIAKIVGRQIIRFPVRLARQLTRMLRQIQILIRNGSFVRSRPLIAGMRAFFVGFANGLSSRIAQHISQNRSDRRDVGAWLRDIQGTVLWNMIAESLRQAATEAVVAGITEPLFGMVGREVRERRMAGEANLVEYSGFDFSSMFDGSGRNLVLRRLKNVIVDKMIEALRQYAYRDMLTAILAIGIVYMSQSIDSEYNRPSEAPSSSSASPESQNEAELRRRCREAVEGIPFFRSFGDGASDPSGPALGVIADIGQGMLESFVELIQPNRPGGPLGL